MPQRIAENQRCKRLCFRKLAVVLLLTWSFISGYATPYLCTGLYSTFHCFFKVASLHQHLDTVLCNCSLAFHSLQIVSVNDSQRFPQANQVLWIPLATNFVIDPPRLPQPSVSSRKYIGSLVVYAKFVLIFLLMAGQGATYICLSSDQSEVILFFVRWGPKKDDIVFYS